MTAIGRFQPRNRRMKSDDTRIEKETPFSMNSINRLLPVDSSRVRTPPFASEQDRLS